MNISFRTLAALCSVAMSLNTGCAVRDSASSADSAGAASVFDMGGSGAKIPTPPEQPQPEDFVSADKADGVVKFYDDGIGVSGGVQVEGSAAVISTGGVYRVSGECDNGQVRITATDSVTLILDGLDLATDDGGAIESSGGGLVISLAEGTRNRIRCSGAYALYSAENITINGSGSLLVKNSGGSALESGGDIKLCGGEISLVAGGDGIVSAGDIFAAEGSVTVSSGGDGIRANSEGSLSVTGGSLAVTSAYDCVQTRGSVFISGGSVKLNGGGGSTALIFSDSGGRYLSARHGGYSTDGSGEFDFSELSSGDGSSVGSKKGVRADGYISISGGSMEISSADDCIYAKRDIRIDGGEISLSTGDDGIHSDSGVSVVSGSVSVENSYNCIEGMTVEISGGKVSLNSRRSAVVAAGGTGIAQSSAADASGRYVSVSGGEVVINAGGSGIDSGGSAAISGGTLTVYSGDEDCFGSVDHRDYFALSGGIFAAFGSDGATKAPNVLSRPCISVIAEIAAGSVVEITDSAQSILFSVALPRPCSTLMFSSEKVTAGAKYFVYVDSVLQKTVTALDGISGDGPSGRVTGIFDYISSGADGKGEISA